MQNNPTRPKSRGVYCRLCGSPVPLPESILKRESLLYQDEPSSAEHWRSRVYGPKGPKMTWTQRAEAGVDAKHFQEALKAKS